MQLPPAIFESSVREAETYISYLDGWQPFCLAVRAECARRGWVQIDPKDFDSWTFHEVAGFDNTSAPGIRTTANRE